MPPAGDATTWQRDPWLAAASVSHHAPTRGLGRWTDPPKQRDHAGRGGREDLLEDTLVATRDALAVPPWSVDVDIQGRRPRRQSESDVTADGGGADAADTRSDLFPGGFTRRVRSLRTQRRREQCRVNQARYRAKQNESFRQLEQAVVCLREEIALFSMLHALMVQGVPRTAFPARVVDEYFTRFRNGLPGANLTVPAFTTNQPGSRASSAVCDVYTRHAAFLRAVLTPEVELGDGLAGPDAALEQWWRYSAYHKHVFFDLLRLESLPSVDELFSTRLLATGRLVVVPDRHTITYVFPRLERSQLAERLLGQPLQVGVRIEFEFYETTTGMHQITRMITDVDLVAGLLRVLGNVDDVNFCVLNANISLRGFIGDVVQPSPADEQEEKQSGGL